MALSWRVDGQGHMRVLAEGEAAGTAQSASNAIRKGAGAGRFHGGGALPVDRLRLPLSRG